MAACSSLETLRPQHQVFINSCEGKNHQLNEFVYHLVEALLSNQINVYEHIEEYKGRDLEVRLKKIEESRIALVIFSGKYTESTSCLRELAKINDCVKQGKLVAIPIFFKLDVSTVKGLRGQFGDAFRNLRENNVTKKNWKEALESIPKTMGNHKVDKKSPIPQPESEIFKNIVEEVKEKLTPITLERNQEASLYRPSSARKKDKPFGIKKSLKKVRRLLLLYFYFHQIIYMSTSFIDKDVVVNVIVQKVFGTKNPRDHYTELPNGYFGAKGGSYFPDAKTNAVDFLNRNSKCPVDGKIKQQVFINFRGAELRNNFISHLVDALQRSEINVFIDNLELRGRSLNNLFKRIEDSRIAIVVFSSRYTESIWCLNELVKIKDCVQQDLLEVLPIFYKVTVTNVKKLKGEFGDHFRDQEHLYKSDEPKIKRWKEAIDFVTHKFPLAFDEKSMENEFVRVVVKEVLKMLQDMSTENSGQCFR